MFLFVIGQLSLVIGQKSIVTNHHDFLNKHLLPV